MQINEYKCKMCGKCCRNIPCELVPDDLPKLLKRFKMSFKDFFIKYLIAIPCSTGDKAERILRLSPVRQINEQRYKGFLEDEDYMDHIEKGGECIFLRNNKCIIHDIKPLGGRIMKCSNMTGGLTFQLSTSQYYVYWYNNQQIFYELSKEVEQILRNVEGFYKKADRCYREYTKSSDEEKIEEYKRYVYMADKLMKIDLKDALSRI